MRAVGYLLRRANRTVFLRVMAIAMGTKKMALYAPTIITISDCMLLFIAVG